MPVAYAPLADVPSLLDLVQLATTGTRTTPDGRVLFHLAPAFAAVARAVDEEDGGRVDRLACRLGVHCRTVLKWQSEGGVDLWRADRLATALGVNAARLWPVWEYVADMASAPSEERPQQMDLYDLAASA